jgi:hypothetical protein
MKHSTSVVSSFWPIFHNTAATNVDGLRIMKTMLAFDLYK